MKTHRLLAILTALFLAASWQCFALTPIKDVSKAEAKDLGMEFQAKAQGSDQVRVTLELKKEGELKTFSRVELWIQDGEQVLFTGPLKDDLYSAKPGYVVIAFTIDRSLVGRAVLHVVVEPGTEEIGGLKRVNEFGYELKLDEHAPPDFSPKTAATKPAEEEDHGYVTPAEIKAMSPRKATVLEHNSCYSMFSMADGKKFSIGSPAAGSQVVEFLNTLKKGATCELPRAFLDFEKASPAFDTAEKIKAMPPCKATVEHVGVHDSRLRTADGKLFFMGGDEATPEVIQFLETLRDKHTCQFPDVFLEYRRAVPAYDTAELIKAMPPCTAVLEAELDCGSPFKTSDGRRFLIGSPGETREVTEFMRTLKEGQSYDFPGVFLDYQKGKR